MGLTRGSPSVDGGNFEPWVPGRPYDRAETCQGSSGRYFASIMDGTTDVDPVSVDPQDNAYWIELRYINIWNAQHNYQLLPSLVFDAGNLYLQIQAPSQGHKPSESPLYWKDLGGTIPTNKSIQQRIANENTSLQAGDNGGQIFKSDGNGYTYTVPDSSLPIGYVTTVLNNNVTGDVLLSGETGVIVRIAGNGTDQDVTVPPWGQATLLKVASAEWRVNGVGIS